MKFKTQRTRHFIKKSLLLGLFFILIAIQSSYGQLIAFPGAEGYGAQSIGGRGGQVIKVTNLDDNGPGSFREAVTTAGPRTVIFEVSGIINLESGLTISEPYLTIAGQTSPGGILVTGYQTTLNAHNTILRHIRFRLGSHRIADGANAETLDAFDIWGNEQGHMPTDAHDIIIDHCSFSWGVDETFSFAYNPRDITVQWNIISEGLSHAGHPDGEHSKGMLVWGKYSPDFTLSLHHNYFASSTARQPLISAPNESYSEDFSTIDVANCVAYNGFGGNGMSGKENIKVNWRHNYIKRGPESNPNLYEIAQSSGGNSPLPYCYVENNLGTFRTMPSDPDWAVSIGWQFTLQSEDWRKITPWPHPEITTTVMTYDYALSMLECIGATKPFRDEVDVRVVGDFAAGTGAILDDVTFPDDFPTFQNLPAPTDTDNDGMPDTWEMTNGLDFSVADNNTIMTSGYTAIEVYINSLAIESCDNVVPTSSLAFSRKISIFPNPTAHTFTIDLDDDILEKVIIYNKLGQQIKEVMTNEVDLSNLATGVYFIKIISRSGQSAIKKVIKS